MARIDAQKKKKGKVAVLPHGEYGKLNGMAKKTEKEVKPTATRAEKTDAAKSLVREVLGEKSLKRTEVIDEAARLYAERYPSGETENANDVKGRIGSVLDVMKKDGEVVMDGNVCSLKGSEKLVETPMADKQETPVKTEKPKKAEKVDKKPKKSVVKAATVDKPEEEKTEKKLPKKKKTIELKVVPAEENAEEKASETAVDTKVETKPQAKPKTPRGRKPKVAEEQKEAPVVALNEEKAEEKQQEPTKKPRAVKKKSVKVEEEKPVEETVEIKAESVETIAEETAVKAETVAETPALTEEIKEEKPQETPKTEEQEEVKTEPKKETVFDMTLLFSDKSAKAKKSADKPALEREAEEKKIEETPKAEPQTETKPEEKAEATPVEAVEMPAQKPVEKPVEKPQEKRENKPQNLQNKAEKKQAAQKPAHERVERKPQSQQKPQKPLTADEVLKETFLKKLRSLGGTYFEYYALYLLERYSLKNGRRLESLRKNGGERDGGVDGEIELTDKFGFKETIYIQAKNWNPDKGDEKKWIVGETLLQQFLGACMHRKAKDGKQYVRGIFMTTSYFTPEAKRLLNDMSDCLIGYDEDDVFEAAKECSFGLVQRNGTWTLDEKLLSGEKAFFDLF